MNLMNTPAFLVGGNHERQMMATEAGRLIGPSRSKLAGDVLWLGFTAFVSAVILVIVCWPLSADLSAHDHQDHGGDESGEPEPQDITGKL